MAVSDSVRREKQIVRTGLIGILANVVLASFKVAAGLLAHSLAIVLDAVNNTTDALSSVITVIGAKLSGKAPDKKHPYGHGRFEYLSAAIISVIVLYAGITALGEAVRHILHPEEPTYGTLTFIVVSVAVAVKLFLGFFVSRKGKALNSDALVNSGKDALLDAVISVTTLAAAIIYLTTGLNLEAYLSVAISLVILKAGVEMLRETISKLIGERADSELTKTVRETICETEGVVGAYDLILNNYGPDRWLGSVHIEVPDTWTADKIDTVSREIAGRVAEKTHVLLTAIGIYSQNSSDDEASSMRTKITETVMATENVLQMHGFYCNVEEKTVRFDVVVDYAAGDMKAVCEEVRKKVQALYPDFAVIIQQDSDFSD